jgi:hypothetical protein
VADIEERAIKEIEDSRSGFVTNAQQKQTAFDPAQDGAFRYKDSDGKTREWLPNTVLDENGVVIQQIGYGSKGTDKINVSDGNGGWEDTDLVYQSFGGATLLKNSTDGEAPNNRIVLEASSGVSVQIGQGTVQLRYGDNVFSVPQFAPTSSTRPIEHPDAVEDNQSATLGQLRTVS